MNSTSERQTESDSATTPAAFTFLGGIVGLGAAAVSPWLAAPALLCGAALDMIVTTRYSAVHEQKKQQIQENA